MTAHDPALLTAALALLEAAARSALRLDPATARDIAQLQGQVFLLDCTQPAVRVYLIPSAEGLGLRSVYEGRVATSLRGSAADFLDLARAEDPASALINGRVELHGDSAPLLSLQACIARLDIDWETPLVAATGDIIGHQLANALRSAFAWSRSASSSLQRQVGEYIHEEGRLSPPRLELEDFYQDIRLVQQRCERLEARLRRLSARFTALQDPL